MMRKRGFELSATFMVVMILAIVVFVGGIYVTKLFFGTATAVQTDVDKDTQAQIEALLSDGSKLAIPLKSKTLKMDQSHSFGLGISNVRVEEDSRNFVVHVEFDAAFDDLDNPLDEAEAGYLNEWVFSELGPYEIAGGEYESIGLYVLVKGAISADKSTQPGTYIFNVYVCDWVDGDHEIDPISDCDGFTDDTRTTRYTAELYDGTVHKIYVEVP